MKSLLARPRLRFILSLILLFTLGSCSQPSQTPGVETQPAEITEAIPSPTVAATMTAAPTIAPTATKTVKSTETPTPTKTPSPTAIPGPEVTFYLPNQNDLPQCKSLRYLVLLKSATVTCTLKTYGTFSISIVLASTPYKTSSLVLPTLYTAVDFPSVGDKSMAGKNEKGDQATAIFLKNKTKVTIVYSTPKKQINIGDISALAKMMDSKDPGNVNPPLSLAFTATQNLDLVKQYFSQVNFWVVTSGAYRQTSDFPEKSSICIVLVPTKTTRDTWSAYLYDKQKNLILNIVTGEMVYQKICSGLTPSYPTGKFKIGDEYEIRLVVGEDWVATFPFVTK